MNLQNVAEILAVAYGTYLVLEKREDYKAKRLTRHERESQGQTSTQENEEDSSSLSKLYKNIRIVSNVINVAFFFSLLLTFTNGIDTSYFYLTFILSIVVTVIKRSMSYAVKPKYS